MYVHGVKIVTVKSCSPIAHCWIHCRSNYNEDVQRVLFIAASDDPNWLKANLQGVNNDLYFSADLFGNFVISLIQ